MENSKKIKIALLGYGQMGNMIESISDKHGCEVVERYWDVRPLRPDETTRKALKDVSVMIDFSVPEAVIENILSCASMSINMVVGTTGWADRLDEAKHIVKKSRIGLVHASNFSLGVNLYYKIVEYAGRLFKAFENYDPFIEESHHKRKKDAPSGTAKVLKNLIQPYYGEKEIPVTSVRAGYIPGIHTVNFDSAVDTIRLQHAARSREGFAEGALLAARWIVDRKGFYEFRDVLESFV
ncbi:4-hydroxy-tetrahydrodipicolinate reductase [bacterium]|nr:4-hydroxy-tetrahydrodipicolinate reductase [bacterium]